MSYVKVQAKTREEAIEKSGLYVGKAAVVTDIKAFGNLKGEWTVHPEFDVVKEEQNDSSD